jgi:Fur family transcriptional regulator, peroxide stress response regulator
MTTSRQKTLSQDEIRRRFHERGLKVTPQRTAIYRSLVESDVHPTAEDLYRTVKRLHPTVSPNTVYYTLGVLREAGLVHEVNYWHDRSRFDGNLALHHHLICVGCRKIEDLTDRGLDRLRAPAHRAGFEVVAHRVEFQGYCAACRKRARRTTNHRIGRQTRRTSSIHRTNRRGGHHG